jgi:hypothetical protein
MTDKSALVGDTGPTVPLLPLVAQDWVRWRRTCHYFVFTSWNVSNLLTMFEPKSGISVTVTVAPGANVGIEDVPGVFRGTARMLGLYIRSSHVLSDTTTIGELA